MGSYDQKLIFAKKTTQTIYLYTSGNKTKFSFAKLATEFLRPQQLVLKFLLK